MKSPLLGFNNNVRHKGRVFHIQTEDSGVKHPHIITHLFADGGRILKTAKRSYAEFVEDPAMAEKVRAMMQEQHKAMFVALREGAYDHLIDPSAAVPPPPPSVPRAVAATSAPAAPSAPSPSTASAPAPATMPVIAPPHVAAPPETVAAPTLPATEAPAVKPRFAPPMPPTFASSAAPEPAHVGPPKTQRAVSRPALPVQTDAILGPPTPSASPLGTAAVAHAKGAPSVDLDALERAAEAVQTPFIQQIQDLPPPPAAVLSKRPSSSPGSQGGYHRSITPVPGGRRATPVPQEAPGGGGKYGQSRPASLFATTRPAEGMSIFGEDLISEKSLDEVILSYLAEDLESPEKK